MKKSNNSVTVTANNLPLKCWVRKGEKYVFTARGGKEVRYLPYVGGQYEEVLKSLEIPYEVVELPDKKNAGKTYKICRYWYPDCYEVEEVTFPVYRQLQSTKDRYVNTGEKYTGKVLTYKTVSKAVEIKATVSDAVEIYKENLRTARIARNEEFLRKKLDGKGARVVYGNNYKECTVADLKVLAAYNADGTKNGYYAIFDMEKLEHVQVITLNVAKEKAPKVIGGGGRNHQYWEYQTGKKIRFVPV